MNFMKLLASLKLFASDPSQPLRGCLPPRPPAEANASPPGGMPGKSCLPLESRGPS